MRIYGEDEEGKDIGTGKLLTLQIRKFKDGDFHSFDNLNILTKETDIYLTDGRYHIEVKSDKYVMTGQIPIHLTVNEENLHQRVWLGVSVKNISHP